MDSKVPNEHQCFALLVQMVHGRWAPWLTYSDPPTPSSPRCPHCKATNVKIHRKHRAPLLDYQCRKCHRVFNAWQGTVFQGTHRTPSELVKLLVGIAEGKKTARLARDLVCNRAWLVAARRKLEAEEFVCQLKSHFGISKANDINGIWLSMLRNAVETKRPHRRTTP